MEEGKVEVQTFEGPVQYEFTNFPAVGTSPRPAPLKKEKKKKRKKEKKRKRPKKQRWSYYWALLPIPVVLYALLFPSVTPIKQVRFNNRIITQRGHDTTAVSMTHDDPTVPAMLVEHMQRFANLPVLCMHHLKHGKARTYQACAVRSSADIMYYMVNPRILKKMGKVVSVTENSIARKEPRQNKRNRCVLAEWTDHRFNLTGHFCGDAAISLQMAIEEFQ